MNRKFHWGIAALIIVLIAAGGFMYWQWSTVQQLKEQIAQDEKILEVNEKVQHAVSKADEKPPDEPGFKWVRHGDHWDKVLIAQTAAPTTDVVPAYQPPAIPAYDGPLSDHVKLIETHPVQALRLQSQERGHWSARWIPPFPPDDTEAAELAKAVYVWIDYYKIRGISDTLPRPSEILHAEQVMSDFDKKFWEAFDPNQRADPRTCDLLKLVWSRRNQPVNRAFLWPSTFDK